MVFDIDLFLFKLSNNDRMSRDGLTADCNKGLKFGTNDIIDAV